MTRQKRTPANREKNRGPVFNVTNKIPLPGVARRAPDNTRPISHYYKQVFPQAFHLSNNENKKNIPTMTNRAGTVNSYNSEKGYGFIRDNISLISYFVYRSCLKHPVCAKDTVLFDIETTSGGLIAINVRKIDH